MLSCCLRLALLVPIVALACAKSGGAETQLPEGPPSQLGDEEPTPEAAPAQAELEPRPANAIYRSELVRATKGGRPAYLLRELAPEPYRPRGAREGWRIASVFPSDPELCAPGCDLLPGDIILTVNGSPLERPEQLSELLAQIDTMTALDVRLVRDGKLHERSYEILDRPAS